MKVTKNRRLDVGYIQLRSGRVFKTVQMKPGILFDLDRRGEVLGIEILSLRSLAPALAVGTDFRATRKKAA